MNKQEILENMKKLVYNFEYNINNSANLLLQLDELNRYLDNSHTVCNCSDCQKIAKLNRDLNNSTQLIQIYISECETYTYLLNVAKDSLLNNLNDYKLI